MITYHAMSSTRKLCIISLSSSSSSIIELERLTRANKGRPNEKKQIVPFTSLLFHFHFVMTSIQVEID